MVGHEPLELSILVRVQVRQFGAGLSNYLSATITKQLRVTLGGI